MKIKNQKHQFQVKVFFFIINAVVKDTEKQNFITNLNLVYKKQTLDNTF